MRGCEKTRLFYDIVSDSYPPIKGQVEFTWNRPTESKAGVKMKTERRSREKEGGKSGER